MNNAVFGKTIENLRKHRDVKLLATDNRRSQLVSKLHYHAIVGFSESLVAIEMKNTKVTMNKPVYLGLPILEISKKLIYEFLYDYIKPKYQYHAKLCYMDTDSLIIYIKTEDFYKYIADDIEKRFDKSNYIADRSLPTGKNKKEVGLMKDEMNGIPIIEFAAFRPKTYSYLMDDCNKSKKPKGTKNCVITRMLKFNDYKNYLLKKEIVLKSQQRFKSEAHDVHTEEFNKIALSNNDDKRL